MNAVYHEMKEDVAGTWLAACLST